MDLQTIKNRYKEIIQETQSENSDDQWSLAYSQMQQNRKKHILTQSAVVNRITSTQNNILVVKEKLAQALSNLSLRQKQLKQSKSEIIRLKQINSNLQAQVDNLKDSIKQHQSKRNQYKHLYESSKEQLKYLQTRVKSFDIDKELMQQQVFFYQNQSQKIKTKLNKKLQSDKNKKESQQLQKLTIQNKLLKNDIQKLNQLLEQSGRQYMTNIVKNSNYLGKPYKQLQMSHPSNLITQTQHFLKKTQVGYGNKQFLVKLVKFISKAINGFKHTNKKKLGSKSLQKYNSKSRVSYNTTVIPNNSHATSLAKSRLQTSFNCNSFQQNIKKNTFSMKNDNKLAESTINSQTCYDILQHFKKSIAQLMSQKVIKKKKILKLVNWVCQSLYILLKIKKNKVQKINMDLLL